MLDMQFGSIEANSEYQQLLLTASSEICECKRSKTLASDQPVELEFYFAQRYQAAMVEYTTNSMAILEVEVQYKSKDKQVF